LNYQQRLKKEADVRSRLSRNFGPLTKRKMKLAGGEEHECDFVSADGRIVGEIKTSEPNKQKLSSKALRTATLGDISRDCLLLLGTKARKRILVLTNRVVYRRFIASKYGKVAKELGIDIRHVPA
jgi:hypothetical protein